MLNARQVCTLWRQGLDTLTAHSSIVIRGQSYISLKAAQILIGRRDTKSNPFPFRTVRMSVMLNEGTFTGSIAPETDVVRLYGSHINFLIVKLITCSTKRRAMLNCLRNIALMLLNLHNLQGLSIYISFVFDNARYYSTRGIDTSHCSERDSLDKDYRIPRLQNLRAFRLVAWNFSSPETEWLYYKILRQSPSLTMLDPDFYMGYSKFQAIFSQPSHWPFQLKCLKLALSGKECPEVYQLLRSAKFPLESIYFDIFEYSCQKQPCTKVVHAILKSCKATLKTLALSFYLNSKAIPPISSSSSGDVLSSSTKFIRKVTSKKGHDRCLSYEWFKPYRLLAHGHGDHSYKLQNLKLRGFMGSLNFLMGLKQLKRLILLDYMQEGQTVFGCEDAFYENIPSLKELYTPYFGTLDAKSIKAKMMDEQYLPIYC